VSIATDQGTATAGTHQVCQLVHDQVELVGDGARGLARAHHELVRFAAAKRALLAVVLLVRAVELHQLHRLLADVGRLRHELLAGQKGG
jgi:hypothetical protein